MSILFVVLKKGGSQQLNKKATFILVVIFSFLVLFSLTAQSSPSSVFIWMQNFFPGYANQITNQLVGKIDKLAMVINHNGAPLPDELRSIQEFMYDSMFKSTNRDFTLLERSALDRALEETQYNINTLFRSTADIVNVGSFIPADALLLMEITDSSDITIFHSRVIRTTTGEVLATESGTWMAHEQSPSIKETPASRPITSRNSTPSSTSANISSSRSESDFSFNIHTGIGLYTGIFKPQSFTINKVWSITSPEITVNYPTYSDALADYDNLPSVTYYTETKATSLEIPALLSFRYRNISIRGGIHLTLPISIDTKLVTSEGRELSDTDSSISYFSTPTSSATFDYSKPQETSWTGINISGIAGTIVFHELFSENVGLGIGMYGDGMQFGKAEYSLTVSLEFERLFGINKNFSIVTSIPLVQETTTVNFAGTGSVGGNTTIRSIPIGIEFLIGLF